MKAYIISDSEYENADYQRLDALLTGYLTEHGYEIKKEALDRKSLAHCIGCFGCWVKSPGRCAIPDRIDEINREYIQSDLVVYLSPIIYGQISANVKNAIDRWIPNVLPTFYTRKDGSTMHPPRYPYEPQRLMLGYGAASEEDGTLFKDIASHLNDVNAFVDTGEDARILNLLNSMTKKAAGGKK